MHQYIFVSNYFSNRATKQILTRLVCFALKIYFHCRSRLWEILLGDELKDEKLKVHPVRPFVIVVFRICQSYIQISCRFLVTDKFLSLCPFVLFCFYCFHFLFNLCVIKLSTLQSRVQPSTNEPDIIFADTFFILNKHVWTMVGRKLSTAKSGVLADVIGPILFRLLQSWCLWQSYFRLLQEVCYSVC